METSGRSQGEESPDCYLSADSLRTLSIFPDVVGIFFLFFSVVVDFFIDIDVYS